MNRWLILLAEQALRLRGAARGINRFPEPLRYFGPGGLPEAERVCAEANRNLGAFIVPPADLAARKLSRAVIDRRSDGGFTEDWTFESPRPSGNPGNDRVQVRVHRQSECGARSRVILFHHPIYQADWKLWDLFLRPISCRVPVAMMAAPYHFGRIGGGRYAGELTMNPNPARMFEAIRQWCWDHCATVRMLDENAGLEVTGIVGYSFGAFQTLLLSSFGVVDVPIVTIASTNRYAFGVTHGTLARGLARAMRKIGIDRDRLFELTASLEVERHVHRIRDPRILYVRGRYDTVDPPPSLDRLEAALRPKRAVCLESGHGTLLLHRRRVQREVIDFLTEAGAIPAGADSDDAKPGSKRPTSRAGFETRG